MIYRGVSVITAKQYLKELKRLDTSIQSKMQEKKDLYSGTVGAIRTDKEQMQASGSNDMIPNLIERMAALEQEINREIAVFVDRKHEIIAQINMLANETYVSLLLKRYVEYKQLEEIAAEMGYTYDYIKKLHWRALQAFDILWTTEITAYEKMSLKCHL